MRKAEQSFTTDLIKWLTYNAKQSMILEVKVCYSEKFNFNYGIKPHQTRNLINVKHSEKALAYKISDADRTQKPFDVIVCRKMKSYFVFHWVRKGNKQFYLVDPDTIQGWIDDGHKSIDEKMIHVMADYVGLLK